jgi:hypothetical protein
MSLLRLNALDGGIGRPLQAGDLPVDGTTIAATDTTNTNLTITGQMLLQGLIVRNPAGVSNENYDTAANLVNVIGNGNPVQNGTQFRYRVINLSANLLTGVFTANTGLVGVRGNVLASTTKDFMCTVTNGSLAQSFSCTTTNGSAVIGGLSAAQAALLTPGMIVTNNVVGTQGQTIIGVNAAAGTVTLSGNANATTAAPGIQFNFSPVVTITGLQA